jgi:hypothetical protein
LFLERQGRIRRRRRRLRRAVTCVDACRSLRQDCRDGTDLGADLARCDAELAAANQRCRTDFPPGSIRRSACLDRAEAESFRCRRRATVVTAKAFRECRSAFQSCARACGPGTPPDDTSTCKSDGKAAFTADIHDCRRAFQVTLSACIDKTPECVPDCTDARATCIVPTQATLTAALATCAAQTKAGLAACAAANPAGSAALQQCVEGVQATAATCRDAALSAATPGLEACGKQYIGCVRACPAA